MCLNNFKETYIDWNSVLEVALISRSNFCVWKITLLKNLLQKRWWNNKNVQKRKFRTIFLKCAKNTHINKIIIQILCLWLKINRVLFSKRQLKMDTTPSNSKSTSSTRASTFRCFIKQHSIASTLSLPVRIAPAWSRMLRFGNATKFKVHELFEVYFLGFRYAILNFNNIQSMGQKINDENNFNFQILLINKIGKAILSKRSNLEMPNDRYMISWNCKSCCRGRHKYYMIHIFDSW